MNEPWEAIKQTINNMTRHRPIQTHNTHNTTTLISTQGAIHIQLKETTLTYTTKIRHKETLTRTTGHADLTDRRSLTQALWHIRQTIHKATKTCPPPGKSSETESNEQPTETTPK